MCVRSICSANKILLLLSPLSLLLFLLCFHFWTERVAPQILFWISWVTKYIHKYIHHIDLLSLLGLLDFLNFDIPYRLKKTLSPPLGWPPMGKNQKKKFFSIFGIRMTQFAKKKQKIFFKLFDPKKFYHPRWGDPQWAKMKKNFFFIFGIKNDSIREKKHKKILTQNLVLECLECGPKKGSKWFSG